MGRYVIRRMLWVVLVVLVVTMITFVIFYVMPPTDPATRFAGKQPTPELVAQVKEQLGLDKPVYQQYALFVKRLFLGDEYGWPGLGFNYDGRVSVRDEIVRRAPISFQLAFGAAIIWLVMGISIGIVSALKRRTFLDRFAMGFALFGVSAPVFWLGLMGLFIFWQKLGLLPGTGYVPFSVNPYDWFMHMIMPWTVLALLYAAYYARMVRGNLIETMGEDYIRTAGEGPLREQGRRQARPPGKPDSGRDALRHRPRAPPRRRDHHRDRLQPPRYRLLGDPVHCPRRPAGGARGHGPRVLPGGIPEPLRRHRLRMARPARPLLVDFPLPV